MIRKLKSIFQRRRIEADMAEEMRLHLELQTEVNLKAGMPPDEARYAAQRQFGNVASIQEQARDQRGWVWLESVGRDIRFAVRSLWKTPGFSLVVILTLALGIGTNTAVFSVVDALLLRALPIKEPERLVVLAATGPVNTGRDFPYPLFDQEGHNLAFPFAFYEQFRDQSRSLTDVAAVSGWVLVRPMVATGYGSTETESVEVEEVSGNYFSTLGVATVFGRTFSMEDDQPGKAAPVTVISYDFWHQRFGADPAVIGKILHIDNVAVTIVGVMASGFNGAQVGTRAKLWLPIQLSSVIDGNIPWGREAVKSWTTPWLHVLGRLRPGVSRDQAAAELDLLFQAKLAQMDPRRNGPLTSKERQNLINEKIEVSPASTGYAGVRPNYEKPASVLMLLVVVMQFVVCANVAGLLLARGAARQREFALRAALGASRSRLVRQMLTESGLLALLAGLFGFLLAQGGTRLLASSVGGLELWADRRMLFFALLATVASGVFFGLVPALRLSRRELTDGIKEQSGLGRQRLNLALIVLQISFAFLLLTVAGLFVRTLHKLSTADTGYQRQHRLLFDLNVAPDYDGAQRRTLYQRLSAAIEALPGVDSASVYQGIGLLGDTAYALEFSVAGDVTHHSEPMVASIALVGPRFFETMGLPLLRGRDFDFRDGTAKSHGVPALIISEWSARKLFGESDPLGRRIKLESEYEIVGVSKDAKYEKLREESLFVFYCPMVERPNSFRVTFVVKTAGVPATLSTSLQNTARAIDAQAQLSGLRTIEEKMDSAVERERLAARLAVFFSLFALILSAMGLFGLLSYHVSRRTREIGIRMALGAPARGIVLLVIRQGVSLGLIGCTVGVFAAFATTHYVASLLYGVTNFDLPAFASATILLLLLAALACWLPARRAAKVDPVVALRAE